MISSTVKLLMAAGIAGAAMPQNLSAKEIILEGGDNAAVAVSIYNNDLAFVRDSRTAALNAGRNSVAFKGVAEKIMPETAMLTGSQISVIEQNYNYNLLTPVNIVNESVGKTVKTALYDEKTGTTVFDQAKILDSNYGNPILQFSYGIETHFPGRLIFDSLPENLTSKPTLSADLEAGQAGDNRLELAYLTRGLSWKADYVADITGADSLNLKGWITLTNESGADYKNALVQLVAGNVNLVSQVQPRAMPMMYAAKMVRNAEMAMADSAAGTPAQEALADYYIYTLPFKTTITDKQSKQVSLLSKDDVKFAREYRLTSPLYLWPNMRESEFVRQNPDVIFKLTNDKASNLGEPLPKGVVRFYENDKSGKVQFLGESSLKQLAAGDNAELKIGQSFDIAVKGKVTGVKSIAKNISEADAEIKFNNAKDKAETVVFEQGFNSNWEVVGESLKHEKKNASTAVWKVSVPAKGQAVLTYKVRLTGDNN